MSSYLDDSERLQGNKRNGRGSKRQNDIRPAEEKGIDTKKASE